MRRIVLAVAPAFALLATLLPALPAQSAIGLDSAASALGAKFVSVSWNWNHDDSGYRVQVSKTKDFSSVLTTRKARRDSSRPPSGRQATVIGHLKHVITAAEKMEALEQGGVRVVKSPADIGAAVKELMRA